MSELEDMKDKSLATFNKVCMQTSLHLLENFQCFC